MNKIANEDELVKKALQVGAVYAKKRAYGEVEVQDSVKLKVEFIYRVLVEDKLIQPLAKDQISDPNMRHKLALWISRQLPADHHLLTKSK
jgi:predicted transcriptional regulator